MVGRPGAGAQCVCGSARERDDAALAVALVTGEVETVAVQGASEQRDWDSAAARARRAEAAWAGGAGAEAVQARLIGDLSQATRRPGPPGGGHRLRCRGRIEQAAAPFAIVAWTGDADRVVAVLARPDVGEGP